MKMFTNNIAAQQTANSRAKNDGGDLFEVEFTLDGNRGKQIFVNGFEVRRFEFDIEFNGGEVLGITKIQ